MTPKEAPGSTVWSSKSGMGWGEPMVPGRQTPQSALHHQRG